MDHEPPTTPLPGTDADLRGGDSVQTADTPVHLDARSGAEAGGVVGPFHLLSVIGEGGFGVVWEAEQTSPVRRRVALKVIKPGMDSNAVVARFEAERQALAVMDHPCIAKVLDGGTTPKAQGERPYFVMELVRGEPITDFCDKHKLDLGERVALFVRVCEAVQHAHTKGVIHRDLKPSNILVQYQDDRPAPKVIDFGVAKALNQRLTERTIFTDRGQLIGTPEYMSPEQAEMSGLDIDTRSDVYSLGVVLYELLTGSLPFDPKTLRSAGFAEIQRIIREVEPPKPSTRLSGGGRSGGGKTPSGATRGPVNREAATRTLKRDLDWVIMRCLEKTRERRYETAAMLGKELQRFLDGEPVDAGPPTTGYRLRRYVSRHKGPITVAGLMMGALSLGLVVAMVALVQMSSALDREAQALREADQNLQRLRVAILQNQLTELFTTYGGQNFKYADAFSLLDQIDAKSAAADQVRGMRVWTRLLVMAQHFVDRDHAGQLAIPRQLDATTSTRVRAEVLALLAELESLGQQDAIALNERYATTARLARIQALLYASFAGDLFSDAQRHRFAAEGAALTKRNEVLPDVVVNGVRQADGRFMGFELIVRAYALGIESGVAPASAERFDEMVVMVRDSTQERSEPLQRGVDEIAVVLGQHHPYRDMARAATATVLQEAATFDRVRIGLESLRRRASRAESHLGYRRAAHAIREGEMEIGVLGSQPDLSSQAIETMLAEARSRGSLGERVRGVSEMYGILQRVRPLDPTGGVTTNALMGVLTAGATLNELGWEDARVSSLTWAPLYEFACRVLNDGHAGPARWDAINTLVPLLGRTWEQRLEEFYSWRDLRRHETELRSIEAVLAAQQEDWPKAQRHADSLASGLEIADPDRVGEWSAPVRARLQDVRSQLSAAGYDNTDADS